MIKTTIKRIHSPKCKQHNPVYQQDNFDMLFLNQNEMIKEVIRWNNQDSCWSYAPMKIEISKNNQA